MNNRQYITKVCDFEPNEYVLQGKFSIPITYISQNVDDVKDKTYIKFPIERSGNVVDEITFAKVGYIKDFSLVIFINISVDMLYLDMKINKPIFRYGKYLLYFEDNKFNIKEKVDNVDKDTI